MSNDESKTILTIRRTPGGAVDANYYYRVGKRRHDEELDRTMRQTIRRARSAVRAFFRGRSIGSFLNLETTWQI